MSLLPFQQIQWTMATGVPLLGLHMRVTPNKLVSCSLVTGVIKTLALQSLPSIPCFHAWRQMRCFYGGRRSEMSLRHCRVWSRWGSQQRGIALCCSLCMSAHCSKCTDMAPTEFLFSLCSWRALNNFSFVFSFGAGEQKVLILAGDFLKLWGYHSYEKGHIPS